MLSLIAIRLLLIALPFLLWLGWMEFAKRRGKPMGSTPWAWLLAAGLLLAALSLIAGAFFVPRVDPDATYVPVQVSPSGEVVPGTRP